MERVKEIILNPLTAISKAKKEKSLNKTLSIMLFSWFVIAVGFFLSFSSMMLVRFVSSIAIFLFGILFSLFLSYIVNIVMNILGGKGKYYDSLTATTYSSLPISFGFIFMAILYAINAMLGIFIGFILIVFTTALSLSIYFRTIKEFYSTDMVTTLVGFLIIVYVFVISLYISMGFFMGAFNFNSLPTKMM